MTRRKSHETLDNRTGNSPHSHRHVCAGASARTGWLRNGHGSVSWFLHRSGGHNEYTPDLEQHRSRSDAADYPHASAIAGYAAAHDTVDWRSQVIAKVNPSSGHHGLIGQVPGVSQGVGVARVVAWMSVEGAPSTPFTTTETCQR